MIALVLSLSLVGGSGANCAGVVDRTAECASPASAATPIASDAKPAPAKIIGIDAAKMPAEIAFAGIIIGLGGGAAIGSTYLTTPQTKDDLLVRDVVRTAGVGLVAWSGMVGAGAFALWIFDASTGQLRPKIFSESE